MLKQLTEQDAGFLYLETAETPQHVGGVSLVQLPEGYAGDFYQDYKAHIARRIHLIPMLHLKLVPLPFDVDHPFWVEDTELDVDYHIRHLTLGKPGRLSQLEELVGRLHSNFLDRSRPLWEFYVIDGLENGQVAIYTKIHHAAMDGASSMHLISTMYDPTPVVRDLGDPPPRAAGDKAGIDLDSFLRGIVTHVVRQEIRAIQYIPEALKVWARLALPDAETLKFQKAVTPPPATPKTLFNVGITSQRAYAMRTLPLSAFKRLAKQSDCKLNDIVLAVCSGALRRYLGERGALPAQTMTAMVPISLREAGDTESANKNQAMICSLATTLDDPWARLMAIRESSTEQKRLISNFKNALLPDLAVIGGVLMRGMVDVYNRAKLADRLPPLSNLTISNVPGPPVPLYIVGAKLMSFYPCSIPFHGGAVNITVESYCDSLDFGLIACRRTVPDVDELADYMSAALEELQQAVAQRQATAQAPQLAEAKPAAAPRARPAKAPATAARKPVARKPVAPRTVVKKPAASRSNPPGK